MRINAYLTFDGQCEAAFQFYEKCLGGRILMMLSYGDSPLGAQAPAEWRGKILHSTFAVGDQVLGGVDVLPGQYRRPQGFSVALNLSDPAEAERIFAALAEGGEVQMPLRETFWALRFGMVVDRFGTPWLLNCGATD